jgi:hypothetical protein
MVPGQYVPGTASFDQLNLQGTGINTINGPVHAAAGVVGTNAWMYQYLEPAGTLAASIGGRSAATYQSAPLTSGTIYEVAMPVEAGLCVCNITLCSVAAQAAGAHAWVGLADKTNTVLTVSTDQTAAGYFAADTLVATPLDRFMTTYSGLYYLFVCVVATTMPTFASAAAPVSTALSNALPVLCGTSLTGQTTPVAVGSNLGVITSAPGYQLYGHLS